METSLRWKADPDLEHERSWRAWNPATTEREAAYLALWTRLRAATRSERSARMAGLLQLLGPIDCKDDLPMARPEIEAFLNAGQNDAGGHTVSHPALTTLEDDERRAEILGCLNDLRSLTGKSIAGFAYPYGDMDARVRADVERSVRRLGLLYPTRLRGPRQRLVRAAACGGRQLACPRTGEPIGELIMPRVSAIIIFYNGASFLAEAIESVLGQTYQDFELLLVDDGSNDGSTEIARAYSERSPRQIRYMEHPGHTNRGMSATRNLGIANARGEFVAFIDADDRWRPNKLAEQVAIMDRYSQLGAVSEPSATGGAGRRCRRQHPNRACPGSRRCPPAASVALYPLGKAAAPCPSDVMLRREVVVEIGGFEEHFTGARQMYEDQAMLAKLYLTHVLFFRQDMVGLSTTRRQLRRRSQARWQG